MPDATTRRLYARLPEMYRNADARQNEALRRFISLVVDQASEVEDLQRRFDSGQNDTSDLVDPDGADVGWLTWLAQHVGVTITADLSETEKRDAVRFASSGWRAATRTAVADAAKSVLTGSRYARVEPHTTTLTAIGQATQWDILVVTRATETPSSQEVLDTIVAKNAKPAGVVLHHESYEATWAKIETSEPTWEDWHDETWETLQDTQ